jgi:parallel beta-helix repeat protein
VAVLIGSWSSPASGATYYVDRSSANCSNSGAGTEAQPYCTITAALNAVGVGGNTILVKPGVYREQVSIPASGASGSPLTLKAFASGVVIDGSDDYSTAGQWTLVSGNVWLASSVTWDPIQVFLDGARADSATVSPTSLPARTFRWVSGAGLYVNAGGGNPATHQAAIGRRRFGVTLPARSWVVIDGLTITRTEDRGINLSATCNNVSLINNTITFTNKAGIGIVGGSGHRIGANIVHDCGDHGIALFTGVTASTIEDNECYGNARRYERAANGIHLNGCPANTIRRNRAHDNEDTGIHVQTGSNNCIEYLNRSWNNGDHGFDHLASTGTIHNSDVAYGNHMDGFSIEGGATGTQLHNCIAANNGLTTAEFDLWVEDTSVNGFVSNYNIFWNSTAQEPVKYMTTLYPTVAAYSAASGKDTQSLQSNPLFVSPGNGNFHLGSGSPAIDNANASSSNWPTLDADNQSRVNTQGVANNGNGSPNYADRGAYEFRGSSNNSAPNGTINTPTNNVTIVAGQTVNFTGTGTDSDNNLPLTFLWNFGGGATNSTAEDPGNVLFMTPGTYTVSFTVMDALGLADPTPATRTVTVNANPAPNGVINTPTAGVTITAGQSVNFTGTGTDANNNTPLTFAWDFGGGAANSAVEDPGAVVFATPGTYTVTFSVADALGASDPTPDTRTVTVNAVPNQAPNGVIDTPAANVTIIAGQSVSFTGTGTDPNNNLPLTFAWNFGGGATNSTVEDPGAVVFSTAGTYTVSFTVTDALGLADPTPATRTVTVTANQAPNGTINTPTANVTIAAGQSVNFTGTGADPNNNLPLTFLWNFGGGATNSTVEDPGNVVFNTPGTYTVSFTVTDAIGLADPTPATRTVTVTGTANQAPNGVINTPTANVTITAGQSVNFTGTGSDPNNNLPLTFAWNFGGGATNSTVEDPGAVVFNTAGTYTVTFTVTDGLGLPDPTPDTRTVTVTATANQAPNGVIDTPTANVTIAAGQSVSFTGTGSDPNNNLPLTFAWNFGGGATNSTVEDPGAVVFSTAGTYTVSFTVTDALGLADPTPATRTVTVTGTANQAPNGVIDTPTANVTITAGQSVSFTGTGSDPDNNLPLTFAWNFGGGAANSTAEDPGTVVFNSAGTYTVSFTVTDALGLADPTPATRTITVNSSGGTCTNVVTNPSFETDLTGWKSSGGTLSRVAGGSVGGFACRVTGAASTSSFDIEDSPRSVASPVAGTVYTFGASVRSDASTGSVRIRIMEYVNGVKVATVDGPAVTLSSSWQRLSGSYTATGTGSNLYFTVKDSPVAASETFDVDDMTACGGAAPPPNQAPNGVIDTPTANATIAAGQSVSFTGTGSDPDNNLPLTFAWNFGGGATNSTVEDPGAVVFNTPGTYTVTFTVKDAFNVADPSPDTRTITVTGTANQAPNGVIDTPTANVTITAGQSVSFTGTGSDPDNNLPLTFAWNFGGGATNSTVEDPGAVVFNTPGTYTVTFTVTDGLGLADPTPATRTVTVNATGNQAPNSVIDTPTANVTITTGQSVSFTGTGSDPDNNLPLTFAWNFGGGAANSTVEDPGAVVFNTAGTYTVTFTVTDGLGLADPTPATRTVTVNAPGGTCTNLVTNPSFETGLTGWKGNGSTLSQVPGGSAGSFACRVTGAASTSSFTIEDSPRSVASPVAGTVYTFGASVRSDASTGSARIRIIEYVNGVKVATVDGPAVTLSPSWQRLSGSYTATANGSNLYFTVKDSPIGISETFDVDDMVACAGSTAAVAAETYGMTPTPPAFIAPSVKPNPVGRQAFLTFSTSRPGPLQVELYDVGGRRVRMLAADSNSPAGVHVLPLDDRRDDGGRLGSGVFFYRIRSVDGSSKGSFLIMK